MFSTCANLECRTSFEYGKGRFFLFHKDCQAGETPPNTHCVQHFWLCSNCCQEYALEFIASRGVVLSPRLDAGKSRPRRSVVAA
jgi:hypothetical protein